MPQYTWNNGFPGEPAPYMPAQIRDGDGRVLDDPAHPGGFRVIGGVWCDTETGEVKYGYQDFDHMNAYGELPTFSYFAKPPLTIESPDEIRPVSSPDGSIKLWHYG